MKHFIIAIIGILFLAILLLQPAQASDEKDLENRIHGFISSMNMGDYYLCLTYVAPPEFTGQSALTKMLISGGDELLFFLGEKLLPLSEYQINITEFLQNGYEARVTIDAKVIYHRKPLYAKKEGATSAYDMQVYPATIIQGWVLLNGAWYIKSMIRLQYIGT